MKDTIKSKRFILRPIKRRDEKSLIKNINHKDIYNYTLTIPYPYTAKDADKWINHCFYVKRKKKLTEINFAIDIGGELIGGIGLINIEKRKAEIGYWLGEKYWSKGIITEAVKLVTNFAFSDLKFIRIYARVNTKNKASCKVLEKNGYELEGVMRKSVFKDGKYIDVALYARVR